MIQSGFDWHLWRARGLGSSDSACVLDLSPYKTKQNLIDEKLGLFKPKVNEFITQKGKKLEPRIRALYELEYQGDFPDFTAEYSSYPAIRCSFDGYTPTKIIEIKFVGLKFFESSEIPPHHYVQIQHQLLVSGASFCHYVRYNDKKDKIKVDEVWTNPAFITELFIDERNLWESIALGYSIEKADDKLWIKTSNNREYFIQDETYLGPNLEAIALEAIPCQDIIQLDHAAWMNRNGQNSSLPS